MKFNFLNNLSFTRLSGATNLLLADFHSGYVKILLLKRKDPFYRLTRNEAMPEVLYSENVEFSGDLSIINRKLKEIVNNFNLKDTLIVCGINDFRYSNLSIPLEVEDIDSWFSENSTKFLPEGRPPQEFTFAYEKFHSDDSYHYYYVIVARQDYLANIEKACTTEGLIQSGIFPFPIALSLFSGDKDKNILLISFEAEKIILSFRSETGMYVYRDLFTSLYNSSDDSIVNTSTLRINTAGLKNSIEELKESIISSTGKHSLKDLKIFISCSKDAFNITSDILLNSFPEGEIICIPSKENSDFAAAFFAYFRTFNFFDSSLNLQSQDKMDKTYFLLEKQINLRYTLTGGVIILMLLVILYLASSIISARIDINEENLVSVSVKASVVENLKKENQFLKANLSLLNKLKKGQANYSSLLKEISKITASGSCLTGINLTNETKDSVTLELNGLAYSQIDVAEIMAQMEMSKNFRDITLIYSTASQSQEQYDQMTRESFIEFKISAKYNVNQK